MPGTTLLTTMPDDTVLELKLDARTAAVALTHDPKLDGMALLEALKSEAFYVGAVGSSKIRSGAETDWRTTSIFERHRCNDYEALWNWRSAVTPLRKSSLRSSRR